ncbi:DUF5615 family PIN-like protein [Rhodococcus sp. NPDC003322]
MNTSPTNSSPNRKAPVVRLAGLGFAAAIGGAVLLSGPAFAQSGNTAADAAIAAHHQEVGGASNPLGQPVGEPYKFGTDGVAQDFQGGKIVWSPETGAQVMYGVILDKYLVLGGGAGDIGFPTNDESDSDEPGAARFSEFSAPDGATIYWSPEKGAWLVRGPIRTAWSHLGATNGVLGSPLSDTTVVGDVYTQTFSGRDGNPVEVRWSKANGFVTVPPAIGAELAGLDVSVPGLAPGAVVNPPTGVAAPTGVNVPDVDLEATDVEVADVDSDSDSNSKWWALIPGLAIAGAAGGLAGLVGRRRGGSVNAPRGAAPDLKTPAVDVDATRPKTPDVDATRLKTPDVDVKSPNLGGARHLATTGADVKAPNLGSVSGNGGGIGSVAGKAAGLGAAGAAGLAGLAWLNAKSTGPDTQLDTALGRFGGVDSQNVTYADAITSASTGAVDGLRFLIDENLSPQVAEGLRAEGYDAVHLRDVGADAGHNGQALDAANRENRILVTNELSYLDDLADSGAVAPSLLVLRRPGAKIAEQTSVIATCAPVILNALHTGSLVTLDSERIRARELPLRRA